jgi:diguanylate cyclase (GGDEF)-like protein/PAS domain S-box-containing protein
VALIGVRLRAAVLHAAEPLLGGLVLNVLYTMGLAGRLPVWVVDGLLLVCVVYQQPGVQHRLTGGDPIRRLWPRLGLHLALYTAVLLVVGWGPLSGLAFIGTLAIHLRWSGSAAWRPAAVLGTAAVVAGQVLIAVGWIYTFLPGAQGHAIAAILAVTALLISRLLGLTVAQREQAERKLRLSEERFRTLIHHSADVVMVTDDTGTITYVSPAVELITGHAAGDLLGIDFFQLVHPHDLTTARSIRANLVDGGERECRLELRLRHADGRWRWHEANVRNLLDHPAVSGIVVNHRDVTERRNDRDRLLHEATHDALTGLVNRATFWRMLDESMDKASTGAREDAPAHRVAVLYLDLDGFKQVNDTMGHEAGDLLLAWFGALLRRCVPAPDVAARLGGDEFAVLLTQLRPSDPIGLARRIVAELAEPFRIDGKPLYVRTSIGIAVSGTGADSASVMLHRADLAMYHAKRYKTEGWQVYVDDVADCARATAALEVDLRTAVRRGQLRLSYQPVVALDSGALIGLEALVRWKHPVHGLLSPQTFVPLAEAHGTIGELGQWVLETACAQVVQWQRRLSPGRRLSLSVNLSPRELEHDPLVDRVLSTLHRTGFDPADLVLEVTENALVDDAAIPLLAALGGHGVRIALDDFGTGYSSLRYLTRLPLDIVKLDRCFVAGLNGTKEKAAIADAVVRLSEVLKLDTIAEGIEHPTQVDELLRLGYRTGQGYHFAKPMCASDVDVLIDRCDGLCPPRGGERPDGLSAGLSRVGSGLG